MASQQLTVQLPQDASVTLSIFEKEAKKLGPIILILPAMGVKAAYYEPFIAQLTQLDFLVISADLRGLGLSSVRPSSKVDWGYLTMLEDLKTIIAQVKITFPDRPIYGLGHSLGGQIASLAQAKYQDLMNGLILVAANSVYYKKWAGKQKYFNLLGYYLFPLLSKIVGYFPGHKVGFGGKAAKTQLIDWAHVGRTGKYKLLGDSLDYEAALQQLTMPVLAVYIEGDWLSPKAAIEHLYGKFSPKASITNFTLTQAATRVKLNHFNWVKNGKEIATIINDWTIKL